MTQLNEKKKILSGQYNLYEKTERKDGLLDWSSKYTNPSSKYYDFHKETTNIVKNKRLRANTPDYTWHNQSMSSYANQTSLNKQKFRDKTAHSITDIGDSLIIIGGMSSHKDKIDVISLKKDISRIHSYNNISGNAPCCRWAHSCSYIAPLNAILMIGGFDSTYNYNDARLLFLSRNRLYGAWYEIMIAKINNYSYLRALHSSTVRYIKVGNKIRGFKRNICEVYVFGGQYCSGGPYIYNNDLFRIRFYDKLQVINDNNDNDYISGNVFESILHAFIVSDMVDTYGSKASPRSQHYAFIDSTNNKYCIYGGLNAVNEFNDMYCLDLTTMIWTTINYSINNLLNPPSIRLLNSTNFRLNICGNQYYYSIKANKLLIMHHQLSLSYNILKPYSQCCGKQDNDVNMMDVDILQKEKEKEWNLMKKKVSLIQQLQNGYLIYIFDLNTFLWDIVIDKYSKYRPNIINGSKLLRIGSCLYLIGGKEVQSISNINRLNNIVGFKIPSRHISWKMERIFWIGNMKNDNNKKCMLHYLPKDIIRYILKYLKSNAW